MTLATNSSHIIFNPHIFMYNSLFLLSIHAILLIASLVTTFSKCLVPTYRWNLLIVNIKIVSNLLLTTTLHMQMHVRFDRKCFSLLNLFYGLSNAVIIFHSFYHVDYSFTFFSRIKREYDSSNTLQTYHSCQGCRL